MRESVTGDLHRVEPADSNRVWVLACGSVLFISLAAGAAYTYYAYSIYNRTDFAINEQQETGGAIVPVTHTIVVKITSNNRCTETISYYSLDSVNSVLPHS